MTQQSRLFVTGVFVGFAVAAGCARRIVADPARDAGGDVFNSDTVIDAGVDDGPSSDGAWFNCNAYVADAEAPERMDVSITCPVDWYCRYQHLNGEAPEVVGCCPRPDGEVNGIVCAISDAPVWCHPLHGLPPQRTRQPYDGSVRCPIAQGCGYVRGYDGGGVRYQCCFFSDQFHYCDAP